VLKSRAVAKAILTVPSGKAVGVVDVEAGKASGLPSKPPPPAAQEP